MIVNIIDHSFDQILPSFKRTLMSDSSLQFILHFYLFGLFIHPCYCKEKMQHRTGSQFSKENENDY